MPYLLELTWEPPEQKTVLFDTEGNACCSKTIEYPMYQPQNGWAEQDPMDWWNAVVEGARYVIGTSGWTPQRSGASGFRVRCMASLCWTKTAVLRRSIIWCDQRTAEECAQMNRVIGEKRVIEITANPPMTGFTASKILWVQNHEPELYAKCAHILLPKDYIRYMLTGEFATEVSDAAGMQLMDIPNRCWSEEVLTKLHIDRSLLGKMYESPDVTGEVTRQAAALTGLREGTIVAGGAGDNPAAAVGTGIVRAGKAFTTIGSSAVVYAVSDTVSIDLQGRVHTLCASVPGKWTVMSCTQAAGLSLKWLRDTCCKGRSHAGGSAGSRPVFHHGPNGR